MRKAGVLKEDGYQSQDEEDKPYNNRDDDLKEE